MPTFEYTGPVPSQPIDYTQPGGNVVIGRIFGARYRVMDLPGMGPGGSDILSHVTTEVEGGERVEAAENPDPNLFKEVTDA